MASVKSLGLHQPSGLQHAINEQLLPPNPSVDLYTWNIYPDVTDGGNVEDELLVAKDFVIWNRGSILQKLYRFHLEEEPIVQALFTYFPASEDEGSCRDNPPAGRSKKPALEKALVVFLKTQAHIYFLSGTSHIVHIPFEVESACAAPVGVIIQRRHKQENTVQIAPKFPRVPPNSFVSSHPTAFTSSQQSTFSIENLGNPKPLKLGLGSTFGNAWAHSRQTDSSWPRLVALTDPLLDIGLIVKDGDAKAKRGKKTTPKKPVFLDPAHEALHIESLSIPGAEPVTLVVTVHREANTYTIWRLTYLEREDPFVRKHKKPRRRSTLRRSSMQPGLASGASTPVSTNFRESFGAPLPGKRLRKTDKADKPLDLVSSLEQQDKESTGVARRSSRRVSSMLARADLSASHERSAFLDQPSASGHGTSRKHDSIGSHTGRHSSSHNHHVHLSLGSLLEAPFDMGLDEGIHNMGLDDHELDGLQHEIMFTEIHTVELENNNFRYSTAEWTPKTRPRVFILMAPPFASNERSRNQLLVGIQDPVDKRLQLIMLHLRLQQSKQSKASKAGSGDPANVTISPGELRVAQNVVDSTKLVDGDQSVILVLSESMDGHHELSIQAPWSELTKTSISTLFAENSRCLVYPGRSIDRDIRQRKSEVMDVAMRSIVGVRHPRPFGVVDVMDSERRLHQLHVQLQPVSPQVRKVLGACKSILPDSVGERIHAGWFHAMQWLQDRDESLASLEWSAVTVLLLSIFLNLGRGEAMKFQTTRLSVRRRRPASGSFGSIRDSDDWTALEMGETANSLGCPPWMLNKGWDWALVEDFDNALSPHADQSLAPKFITRHIGLAKEFILSPVGESAVGHSGFLPTALCRPPEARRKNAVDIFMALHLLLEEQKLDIMTPEYNSPGRTDLRVVLCQVARWLGWYDFWTIYELGIQEDVDQRHDGEFIVKPPIEQPPVRPDILHWIQTRLIKDDREAYPTPGDMFYSSAHLPETETKFDHRWDGIVPRTLTFKRFLKVLKRNATAAEMVEAMHFCGMTPHFLETLPEAVLVPLRDAISLCQPRPPASWSTELLELVKRSDISLVLASGKRPRTGLTSVLTPTHNASRDYKLLCQSVEEFNNVGYDEGDGTERQAVIRALFKEDRRLNEVQDILSTHKARVVRFQAEPEWAESTYLEKQKEFVSRVATGTLAIPSGRAMLYYSLRYPLITQKFHIGGFNLNCVVKPSDVTVGVDKSHFTEEKVCWGFFHQGVAAGLAISPQAKGIDSSWILYNKPGQDLSNRHAGFLLALGLNGHLKGVAKWVAFKYLTPKHTMTSIGLLLGLAASYMGTMDSLITRLLSVHATRMLPRGAAELNLSPLTQTSGIMGIGLLYYGSQHRRMSEIMLSEIEYIETEDEEEPLRSECYRLAAGFSLGLINLGKGNDLKGLHDLKLTEKLIMHATATKNVEIVHILDRAAAGAVMAIALIFMKSEDHIVARKIDVPESVLQFDYVRPDILLLRTVAKNIIMWSKIQPTFAWVKKSLPIPYHSRHRLQTTNKLRSTDLPFFSILAGICLSIALRFSGSASVKVRDLLLHYLDQFIRITRIPSSRADNPDISLPYDEELARANARMCQDVVALAASIVMSGTGDVEVLRRLRSLHGRDDATTPYGSHLAAHLAIGALFLGCGTATFGSSNLAIASLLISFYPIFPNDVMDNRSHLQAFRHFWVLATEQRCLVAKDVLTDQPVSVPILIKMKHARTAEDVMYRTTPCLLPPLDQIARLSTHCSPRFWDIEVDFEKPETREAFMKTQSIYLRRRPPREGAFPSTLRALGKDDREGTPLEWVFGLEALREVSYAERASIMDSTAVGDEQESGHVVDSRMEMEKGIEDGGDRERLEGARLLFQWGGARESLLKPESANVHDSMTTERERAASDVHDDDWGVDEEGAWWMRDSTIEALKGKVMLAGREAEP